MDVVGELLGGAALDPVDGAGPGRPGGREIRARFDRDAFEADLRRSSSPRPTSCSTTTEADELDELLLPQPASSAGDGERGDE